jgi:hypothetical protein
LKKTFFLLFVLILFVLSDHSFAQAVASKFTDINLEVYKKQSLLQDTTRPVTKRKSFSLGGIFISAGTGLNVPLKKFYENSTPAFGILGRLEYSSYSIFPFVTGGVVTYFSYIGDDEFKSLNLLSSYRTKILSYGLSIEYTLSKLLNSSYTIPFVTVDVKSNNIKREYDDKASITDLPRTESKISIGGGVGFTLFVLDFYVKYNYMKDLSNFGVYTKIKFPVIRF